MPRGGRKLVFLTTSVLSERLPGDTHHIHLSHQTRIPQQIEVMMPTRSNTVNQWLSIGVSSRNVWGITYRSRDDLKAHPNRGDISESCSRGALCATCRQVLTNLLWAARSLLPWHLFIYKLRRGLQERPDLLLSEKRLCFPPECHKPFLPSWKEWTNQKNSSVHDSCMWNKHFYFLSSCCLKGLLWQSENLCSDF